ncbi:hypothetical protein J7T55_010281 [Diaporthe amygdali]|uniref:uncharacterized protein n=1 Tax=Phomopsis amygdali TaxID=1214568 RepID=UPI0022FE1E0E|nr:uncharacterized protein J7T55_010281 [Diaporthe amygdali]KAJ0107675.1 hypothetical protein J7T55_010281 [Diaporthe amygdali]
MPYTYYTSSATACTANPSHTYTNDHASTTAQHGSTGTRARPKGQKPRVDHEYNGNKEERMKNDLIGIGAHFEGK